MSFPGEGYQLMLLPARTARDASRWGSAAMEYAAAFPNLHFARDPERVDWRSYTHVSLVRPVAWPPELPLIIKQANPAIFLDRIPVDTPEVLRFILYQRLYYGWRYGPQTEQDWAQLWPPGVALAGLHGRADGELQPPDVDLVRRGRLEAVKVTSHATMQSVAQIRAVRPDAFVLVRAFLSFDQAGAPRRVSPQEFFDWTAPDVARLVDADPQIRFIEIHNEPNLRLEGLGGSWNDGAEFGQWFLRVMELYRARFPEARLGFPGLSPGPTTITQGRRSSELFLSEAAEAARQADWVGLHAYWTQDRELSDEADGFAFVRYRERFPGQLLFVTEFGNPYQPKPVVASQYARYYAMLRRVPGLGAAFAYVASTSNPVESPLWAWRDENGADRGVAAIVGQRPAEISPPP